ncbi:MAG: NTP transferase domain-containing protein [Candidatus Heimdallarchaeota archaeon]|nr:NTP transferase domain-containing protein [Candidatus Heimdallarchaeota archaeon]
MNSDLDYDVNILILAGGYSRRFGNEIKALQYFEGQTLLARRLWSLRNIGSEIIVSVSSEKIQNDCISSLKETNLDLRKFNFHVDVIEDQGPMKALLNIIPKLRAKFGLVIGVDNLMIDLNDMTQLISVMRSTPKTDLVTVSINKERIIASFLAFDVDKMKILLSNLSQSSEFERLTDIIRIVDNLSILNFTNEGQFINVNKPEQLKKLEGSIIDPSELAETDQIKPKYHGKFESSCKSFKNELQSWLSPEIIPHIKNNILKDAKKILGDLYKECDLE